MRHAVYSEYGEVNSPVDLLVVAGLNNIARGLKRKRDVDTVEYFANEIHLFNTMSVAMNLNMGKTSGKIGALGTLAFATLPYPPMMTQLHKDPRDHKLKEEKSGIIRRINDKIQSFNRYREQSLCVRFSPNFHLFGLKIIKYDEVRAGDNPLIDAGERVSVTATQHRGPCWRVQS